MKELFLKIEYSDFVSFKKVFSLLQDENFDFVEIEIVSSNKLDNGMIDKIINAETVLKTTAFQNSIFLPYHALSRLILKKLQKYHFRLILEIDLAKE
ncbi:MAG: hypothetical protein MJ076_04770, partial [Clostridia bacterium]|nr:hypothetical protein [Clostridia bacterium]